MVDKSLFFINFVNQKKKYYLIHNMEYNKEIFGQRLKSAREMRGLSMADLSQELSGLVTRQSICKYEAGKMLPDSAVLLRLARILGVKPDYFFRPFSVALSGIEFRKKASMSSKACKSVEQQVLDKVERYFEIEEICGLPHVSSLVSETHPIHYEDDVKSLVSLIRKEWGLGDDGIIDVIGLLESRGIKVVEIDCPESFDGLSGMAGNAFVIVINKAFQSERKRFTALHELGHLVMQFDETIDNKKKEALCHLFASEFLIPQNSFMDCIGELGKNRLNIKHFADIQRAFGISIDALIRKAYDAGLISASRYKYYFIQKNKNPQLKEYVERSRAEDEHPERFESLVYDAYSKDIISVSKAASLLNTSVDHILSTAVVM